MLPLLLPQESVSAIEKAPVTQMADLYGNTDSIHSSHNSGQRTYIDDIHDQRKEQENRSRRSSWIFAGVFAALILLAISASRKSERDRKEL